MRESWTALREVLFPYYQGFPAESSTPLLKKRRTEGQQRMERLYLKTKDWGEAGQGEVNLFPKGRRKEICSNSRKGDHRGPEKGHGGGQSMLLKRERKSLQGVVEGVGTGGEGRVKKQVQLIKRSFGGRVDPI